MFFLLLQSLLFDIMIESHSFVCLQELTYSAIVIRTTRCVESRLVAEVFRKVGRGISDENRRSKILCGIAASYSFKQLKRQQHNLSGNMLIRQYGVKTAKKVL